MRQVWEHRHVEEYGPTPRNQLSRMLVMKRPVPESSGGASQPGQSDDVGADSTAFAPQEETGRAILSACRHCTQILERKGVAGMCHALTPGGHGNLTKDARQVHAESEDQNTVQAHEFETA